MKETEEVKKAKAVVQRRCFSFAAQLAELLKLDPAALIPGAAIAPRAFGLKALKLDPPPWRPGAVVLVDKAAGNFMAR